MSTQTKTQTHKEVQEYYGRIARQTAGSCCGEASQASQSATCCGQNVSANEPVSDLYNSTELAGIPQDIVGSSQGSGDPIQLADLKPGETVIDLGSGTGLDCILAARLVGEKGHVIGVDMTPEMLERARANIARLKIANVEFREGLLEALPVTDNAADVILSNCVINLSPDKPQVLHEMFRVLKPGGRIAISDTVANHPVAEVAQKDREQWCACTSGALTVKDYTEELGKAGFENIRLEPDIEVIKKAIESDRAQVPGGRTKEKALRDLEHLETVKEVVVAPYKITANKPK